MASEASVVAALKQAWLRLGYGDIDSGLPGHYSAPKAVSDLSCHLYIEARTVLEGETAPHDAEMIAKQMKSRREYLKQEVLSKLLNQRYQSDVALIWPKRLAAATASDRSSEDSRPSRTLTWSFEDDRESILEILADIMILNMQYMCIDEQQEGGSLMAQSEQIEPTKAKLSAIREHINYRWDSLFSDADLCSGKRILLKDPDSVYRFCLDDHDTSIQDRLSFNELVESYKAASIESRTDDGSFPDVRKSGFYHELNLFYLCDDCSTDNPKVLTCEPYKFGSDDEEILVYMFWQDGYNWAFILGDGKWSDPPSYRVWGAFKNDEPKNVTGYHESYEFRGESPDVADESEHSDLSDGDYGSSSRPKDKKQSKRRKRQSNGPPQKRPRSSVLRYSLRGSSNINGDSSLPANDGRTPSQESTPLEPHATSLEPSGQHLNDVVRNVALPLHIEDRRSAGNLSDFMPTFSAPGLLPAQLRPDESSQLSHHNSDQTVPPTAGQTSKSASHHATSKFPNPQTLRYNHNSINHGHQTPENRRLNAIGQHLRDDLETPPQAQDGEIPREQIASPHHVASNSELSIEGLNSNNRTDTTNETIQSLHTEAPGPPLSLPGETPAAHIPELPTFQAAQPTLATMNHNVSSQEAPTAPTQSEQHPPGQRSLDTQKPLNSTTIAHLDIDSAFDIAVDYLHKQKEHNKDSSVLATNMTIRDLVQNLEAFKDKQDGSVFKRIWLKINKALAEAGLQNLPTL